MIVGTAGHVDHGKTSLVRALTGVDTDRLKEEKARGISIDLGFAYMPAPDGQIVGFVDVPGHEKFIHNMLAGATGIDFVMLVVAADDGVMPQTREHLAIVDLLGVSRGIVVLSKIDLVSAARQIEVTVQISHALRGTRLAGADVIPASIKHTKDIDVVRDRLVCEAQSHSGRTAEGSFRLTVDRSFTLTGIGTVVTGAVLSGQVAVGDHVVISPSGLRARIRSIHAQNQAADIGVAGERCALNLAGDGISKEAIIRGDVVLDPELHAPTDRIDALVRLLATEPKPISQWLPVRLHHASTDVAGRIVPLDEAKILPGGEGHVQLVLEKPIAAAVGDRFVLRDTTAQRTIGGGRFIDLRAPARKRRAPERLAQLEALAIEAPDEVMAALLDCNPLYLDVGVFTRDRALAATEGEKIAAKIGAITVPGTQLAFAESVWSRIERGIVDTLTDFHKEKPDAQGVGLAQLRLRIEQRLPPAVFVAVIQTFATKGIVAIDGSGVRLPGHALRLTAQDEALWKKIQPRLSDAERFRPPRVRDLAEQLSISETNVRRLLKLLARVKIVDEVASDHYFLRATVAEIVEICANLAAQSPNGEFIAAQLRNRLDNGRKVAIQILEFFDRHGVTLRRGDQRRINKQRLNQFGNISGGETSPVGRPDFKSGRGREPVSGGFDSLSLPPRS
jgi:selenocysteine-specific elongation factor